MTKSEKHFDVAKQVAIAWGSREIAANLCRTDRRVLKLEIEPSVLGVITLGTAGLLLVSVMVTFLGNARFNWLARRAREDWRNRLYSFVSDADWNSSVLAPLWKSQFVYRAVLAIVIAIYAVIIGYLVWSAKPEAPRPWIPISQS